MAIVAQRIIRSKGSKVAKLVGSTFLLDTVSDLMAKSVRNRKVFVYVDSDGNEGTIRSGRKMRKVDLHVKNTVSSFTEVQLPLKNL